MTKRRSLAETRAVLLDAGAALLVEKGVPVTLDRVTMIDVCRRAGLSTAGSAYKIWPNQQAFRADVLRHLVAQSASTFPASAHVAELLGAGDDLPDLYELLRIACAANTKAIRELYPMYLLVWLAQHTDDALRVSFAASEADWFEALEAMFTGILELYDYEFVPPFDAETFTLTLSALSEGLAIRHRATPELVPDEVLLPTGRDGALQAWTPLAIGIKAVFEAYTRPRH
jgi:AcrR family transcriptional regulator